MNRRFGKFRIHAVLVRAYDPMVTRIMGSCGIVRAEHMLHSDVVEYVALSRLFRELEQGETIPEYEFVIHEDGSLEAIERGKYPKLPTSAKRSSNPDYGSW
jgi:hypothetical protein